MSKRNVEKLFDNTKPFFMVNCGKSNKGKSHMTKFLLMDLFRSKKLQFALVFTTTNFNKDYNFLPEKSIIEGYDEEILETYVNNLKHLKEEKGTVPRNIIIFEDCVGILKNQTAFFTNFMSMSRHLNTSIIINVQYLLGRGAISSLMREQITHCLMFLSRTKRTLQALYENFGGLFPSEKMFKEYFFQITKEPYVAMLYLEAIDDLDQNYIPIQAPEQYPELEISF